MKQSLDFFTPDEASLFRLVQGWGSAPGPVNSITLADDMSFVRNVIMGQSSFETKITKGQNYTLSSVIPTFYWKDRWPEYHRWPRAQRLLYSLETISRAYLRSAQDIYVEREDYSSDSSPISGTHNLPMLYKAHALMYSSTRAVGEVVHFMRRGPRAHGGAIIASNKYYCRNPAAWRMVHNLAISHRAWMQS